MNTTLTHRLEAFALVTLGLAIGAMGLYIGEVDDAPGAGGIGLIVLGLAVVLAVKTARGRLANRAVYTSIAAGLVIAAMAASLTRGVMASAPLFVQQGSVPSTAAASSSLHAEAIERAREIVRSGILEQNLPGVSVAVGAGDALVWSEGFGWRDVGTRTPVTAETRFAIGTAASVIPPGLVQTLGLNSTGADSATDWSPEAIGEEGEDFPPLALLRHVVWQPLGLMAMEYPLTGSRATFYVPIADDSPRRGRRLMAMRDLACCADGKVFSSTPSDLVRVALASNRGPIDGSLAGGTVMSVRTLPDAGIVVAVTSNIAHANTPALAQRIAEAFAGGKK
jgi:hypothetical protein